MSVSSEHELAALAHEGAWVVEGDTPDHLRCPAALAHGLHGLWDGEGIADAPVAGAVHPDALGVAVLQHVDGAVQGAFALGIERDAGPEAVIEHMVDGVLLDMVDDDALGLDLGEVFQRIDDEARAFEFVPRCGVWMSTS